jgi:DNA-binding MarR family transcriptional regulator
MQRERLVDRAVAVAAYVEAELEEALELHDLSRPSYLVLEALAGAEGGALSQRALMRVARRTSGALSIRLARLGRAGLVERSADPANRRSVTVTLTAEGRALLDAARPAYEDAAARLAGSLPGDVRAGLEEQLGRWLAFFEPDERVAPRLGLAIGPPALASRMRRDVGLPDVPGVIVRRVAGGSPAERAGLARGDLVVAADGAPVRSVGDLDRAVRAAGDALDVDVVRGVEELRVPVAFDDPAEATA